MKPVVFLAAILVLSAVASAQDQTTFVRTYKAGETSSYTVTTEDHMFSSSNGTLTVDIDLTVKKVLDGGRAEILRHMSNQRMTGSTTSQPLPPDDTIRTTANNMPANFKASAWGQLDMILFLAGSTADKTVKVGDETPWSWDGGSGSYSCKATTKLTEVSADKKTMKAVITGPMSFNGQHLFDFSVTSVYDSATGSLVQSDCEFTLSGKLFLAVKIARK